MPPRPTVASFEAIGAVLAIAMIVVPAATAHLLADRLPAMLGVAVAHALLSSVAGMYLSIWINCSTAGAVVVFGGALYGLAFLFAPKHGLVWRKWKNVKARRKAEANKQRSIGAGEGIDDEVVHPRTGTAS